MKTKEVKRREANTRNAACSKLSAKQRLAEIAKRPGQSKREVARLSK